jgi:hypothetical protein
LALLGGKLPLDNLFKILALSSVASWAVVAINLFLSKEKSNFDYIMLFMASVPLTCIIPSVSHDYKLVVLLPVIILFLAYVGMVYLQVGRFPLLIAFVSGSLLFVMLSLSTLMLTEKLTWFFPPSSIWITLLANKLPLILCFEFLSVLTYFSFRRTQLSQERASLEKMPQ